MNAQEVLTRLEALEVRVVAEGDCLRFHPASRVPSDLLEVLQARKAEVLEVVRWSGWPAASRECVRRFGRPEARFYPLVGRVVRTPKGLGRLIAVSADWTMVLDDAGHRTKFLHVETGPLEGSAQPGSQEKVH